MAAGDEYPTASLAGIIGDFRNPCPGVLAGRLLVRESNLQAPLGGGWLCCQAPGG